MPSGPLYDYAPDVVADQQPQLLPVADPPQQYDYLSASGRPRVVIQSNPDPVPTQQEVSGGGTDGTVSAAPQLIAVDHDPWETVKKIKDKLLGTNGEERYQLWPEKLIRSGVTAAGDALQGNIPQYQVDPNTGDVHTSPQMIERALDMSSVAGTGGLAGADATLGSTPFLRPALKYEGKIYKAPMGGQHLDALPPELAQTFQKQAMSGEDISNFNFGFMNEKGKFLNREQALEHGINTGLIDPHAGKYGALTSTLLADSSKPGTAIESLAKTNAPTFYSALEHNVNNISQPKMTGDQWLGTLSNKPGVKPEELQWTGLGDFLKENKGNVLTKQQIQDHLQNNKVELKEVNKGDPVKVSPDEALAAHSEGKPIFATEKGNPNSVFNIFNDKGEILPYVLKNKDKYDFRIGNHTDFEQGRIGTKYHSYQLPGATNYREMLLTLPGKRDITKLPEGFKLQVGPQSGKIEVHGPGVGRYASGNTDEEAISNFHKIHPEANTYKSSHWDEPNILAHVRMNDRTIDGKKSLHLEEIQSDWHQQGRDKGYTSNIKPEDINMKFIKGSPPEGADPRNYPGYWESFDKQGNMISRHGGNRPEAVARQEAATLLSKTGVPDAPFKKTWHELALKRMIREAAEKGYDRLSWTPGEAQAARYDLSKQVGKIYYNPDNGKLVAYDKSNSSLIDKIVPKDKLADNIGKEAADRILNNPTKIAKLPDGSSNHVLDNADLKIGGEGMKGFYDSIIPKALEKMTKEHGVKVKKGEIDVKGKNELYEKLEDEGYNPEDVDIQQILSDNGGRLPHWLTDNELNKIENGEHLNNLGGRQPMHYIDIPQSLKDVVMKKGQPLFAAGVPIPLMPVDHDPFKSDKK